MNAHVKAEGSEQAAGETQGEAAQKPARRRRFGRIALMALLPLVMLAAGAVYWLSTGRYEDTENANFRQPKLTIAADVSGRVTSSAVSENANVNKGDPLFTIDPEPYRIALAQADAALQAARLNVAQLRASYRQAVAQEKAASDEAEYLESEASRQEALVAKGVAKATDAQDARHALTKARDQLDTLRQQAQISLAALGGDPDAPADQHPSVLAAIAARDKAAYNLQLTKVTAPAAGTLYQADSFREGQYVTAGTPLFSLVESKEGWVEANFKETQITNLKPGQKAEVVIDAFPDRKLEATIEAVGAGTGTEFSLLPAQNATGNWVKVTQRIPVTLHITSDTQGMTLRSGLSASVRVDTGAQRNSLFALLPFARAAD